MSSEDIVSPDDLIQEGVDEFKMAAAKTATGIIEQGLAVLKIKQGCELNTGGKGNVSKDDEFPAVAQRLLKLARSTADMYAEIGSRAEYLTTVVGRLPNDSVTTIYRIARMDEATIADKIDRGVIHPTATRDNVLEKVRVQTSVSVSADDNAQSLGDSVAEVFSKLAAKDQKTLNEHMKAVTDGVRKTARKEAAEELKKARAKQKSLDEDRHMLKKSRAMVQEPFTREEFKLILGMLHPDRHPGNEDRAQRAFDIFKRIEFVCKKTAA